MIPEDWEVVDIDNISEVIYRYPTYFNISYVDVGVPEIRGELILDSGEMEGDRTKYRYIPKATAERFPRTKLKEGDFVISVRGTMGKIAIIPKSLEGANITANLMRLSFNRKRANSQYLKQYFLSKLFQNDLEKVSSNTTIKTVKASLLKSIKLGLPSLFEQEQIANILSTVDARLDIVERESQRVERLKVGIMKGLFDGKKWKLQKITDIFEIETGTTPSTKVKEYWGNGTVNWITPADMNNLDNTLDLPESKRKITQKALKEVNLTLMPTGSIVISTRAPVGYIGIVKKELTFNQGCKGLIPKDKSDVNTIFYAYYLLSLQEYLNNISGGSTFKELSKDSLRKLELPVPSISEQNGIAEILLTVDKKLSIQKSKKSKLESIKKSLMNDLLTGKKRVKVI